MIYKAVTVIYYIYYDLAYNTGIYMLDYSKITKHVMCFYYYY